jgi:hypothetical protein
MSPVPGTLSLQLAGGPRRQAGSQPRVGDMERSAPSLVRRPGRCGRAATIA